MIHNKEKVTKRPSDRECETLAIHVDTINGVPGTDPSLNGAPTTPVNNYEDAKILMDKLGTDKIKTIEN
jgi:hypothetical protein